MVLGRVSVDVDDGWRAPGIEWARSFKVLSVLIVIIIMLDLKTAEGAGKIYH